MSNFKIGNSKFVRFVNGKGFYIALAICLVAIGTAAYVAVNNSTGLIGTNDSSNVSSKNYVPSSSIPNWDSGASSAAQTNKTVSGVSASSKSPSSSAASSKSSESSTPTKLVFTMPVSGSVLTAFSANKPVYDKTMDDWRVHDGVDITGTEGTPVKACASGTVSEVKVDDMLGQEVIIDHGNGLKSIYANLTNQVTVKKGQKVEVGDTIGAIGETAQAEIAESPHLHIEMTRNGKYIDPLAEISGQD